MWMLNSYFFVIIFAAIRTGQLWTMIPIMAIYWLLLHWITEEDYNGTDYPTERPTSSTYYHIHWVLDDSYSDMDNSKAR